MIGSWSRRKRWLAYARSGRAVLAAMEELAGVLPDDTWIWSFQLDGDRLVIRGRTPSASGLIGRIESSPRFRSVGFDADHREEGKEQFQIAMRVAEDAS
ncbi:MAG: PilN domain-containing protein [Arhodomonas sp.]|nr:PilN domain-containing protein [Arhodomonas sp.]